MSVKARYIRYLGPKARMQDDGLDIVDIANGVIEEYKQQGFDLTLRQLYYQFVSADLFPASWFDEEENSYNTEKNYKRLGGILNKGRLLGLVDWTRMVDRTRNLQQLGHYEGPEAFIQKAMHWYNRDLWATQPVRVEVWIEKDALIGVISDYCVTNDIPYFSCRGYTSQSEMWAAGQRMIRRLTAKENPKATVVLHLGDHDPSGLDMSRDIEDRLKMFVGHHVEHGDELIKVLRIALNPDQIEQYKPPPNPAKQSDSRFKKYQKLTGFDQSWELDSMKPAVLVGIIEHAVEVIRDADAWEAATQEEDKERDYLLKISDKWDEITGFLDEED